MLPQNRSEGEAALDLGTSLIDKGRFHDAIEPLLRAAAISGTAAQRRATATALLRLGFGLGDRQNYAEALRVHARAAAIFAELGDAEQELQCRTLIGICEWQLKAYESAIQIFESNAENALGAGRTAMRAVALLSISCILVDHLRQYRRAVPYATEAARLFRSTGDHEQAAHALRHLDEARHEGNP
ncbi:tetratricopeptide repeat protein [Streptomyces solicathayae]|uniref:Tetratricopeptide repeat protein n=1 Tax=Streptomyces solicathayae TaxID=3081768 RepID=A0ABZ0LMG6_9ACTN|nr:tetratricopeptide repeat protein [Streptomyces sp. HUAS YS2]WOX20678.1 tetratricopeptide repeat protein [Streptomyces sp. HUAS YS2]